MKRQDDRHRTAAAPGNRFGIWQGLGLLVSLPALLPMLLGDLLAAPFTARRHESTFRWLLFMTARFLGPAILIGATLGYLIKRHT